MTLGDRSSALPVVVSVLTFRRQKKLDSLLAELVRHTQGVDPATWSASVLVVDNDPEQSARSIVDAHGVRYVCEATPGIAAARSRAVAAASDARVMVFIDDDVWPEDGWFSEMLGAWLSNGRPAGIVGRVSPTWDGDLDPWIEAGGFFVRPSHSTGETVPAASSANLLLDLDVLRRLGVTFDADLGLRGGEDTLLTKTLVQNGERLLWCDEAAVLDPVPPARLRRDWVLTRAYSHGIAESRTELTLSGGRLGTRVRLAIGGSGRYVAGSCAEVWGSATRRVRPQARGARLAHRGRGMVAGALGRDINEYERSPGLG